MDKNHRSVIVLRYCACECHLALELIAIVLTLVLLCNLFLSSPDTIRKTLKEGDIDDITDMLTPKALTKCDNNALLMAMEVRFDKETCDSLVWVESLSSARAEASLSPGQNKCCYINPIIYRWSAVTLCMTELLKLLSIRSHTLSRFSPKNKI